MKTVKILALSCVLLNLAWTQSSFAMSEADMKVIQDYYERQKKISKEDADICHAMKYKSKMDHNNNMRTKAGMKTMDFSDDEMYQKALKAEQSKKIVECP